MKELTPKQEKFAQYVADGKSQSDAYRMAFDVGVDTKNETIQANSCRLMADANVSARVAELKAALAQKGLWTREDSVRTLLEVINAPDRKSDVIAAIKELNLMHGFNAPQKLDINGTLGIERIERVVIKPTDGK